MLEFHNLLDEEHLTCLLLDMIYFMFNFKKMGRGRDGMGLGNRVGDGMGLGNRVGAGMGLGNRVGEGMGWDWVTG